MWRGGVAALAVLMLATGCTGPSSSPDPTAPSDPSAARSTGSLATPSAASSAPQRGSGRTSAKTSAPPTATSGATTSPAEEAQDARQQAIRPVLSALATDARGQDKTAFTGLVSDVDQGFASTAASIYRNLGALQVTRLDLVLTGQQRVLNAERTRVLGRHAIAAQVMISWRLPHDQESAQHLVWMTFRPDRAPTGGAPRDVGSAWRWAGINDGPTAGAPDPLPLWWLEPVTVTRGSGHTVIAGSVVDGDAWLRRTKAAATAVADRLATSAAKVPPPDRDWNRGLVVEVPSTQAYLEQMVGSAAGSDSQLAAITWPDAMAAQSAPMRILINPEVADQQSELGLGIVLTHEATHAATRSPASGAPLWLVEGFADYVAYATYPNAQGSAAADLYARVRSAGAPAALPDNQRFSPQAKDLSLAYAEAWYACRYLARHGGADRLNAFYASVDRSPDGTIDAALKKIYAITPAELNSRVRADLTRAARG